MTESCIHDLYGFQHAFISLARRFYDYPSEERMSLIERIYTSYHKYIAPGTAFCVVRDLTDADRLGAMFTSNENPELLKFESRLAPFIASLRASRDWNSFHDSDTLNRILTVGPDNFRSARHAGWPYEKETFPAGVNTIPILGPIEDIAALTNEFLAYSCGRHTYMPDIAKTFIISNYPLFSRSDLSRMAWYIRAHNMLRPDTGICDDNMLGTEHALVKYCASVFGVSPDEAPLYQVYVRNTEAGANQNWMKEFSIRGWSKADVAAVLYMLHPRSEKKGYVCISGHKYAVRIEKDPVLSAGRTAIAHY